MPLLLGVLCVFAIAYRYYSAFLAARVAVLDDLRQTPAERFNDGQNYHPTSKWVLFGHHFAAISGAGPLIGPVLAAQFGFLPGLLWIVVGVCLAGAVQDFLVMVASTRRDGKSLAQIAFTDIGRTAGTAATIAIVLILIVALAGLGKVVVKALGGEEARFSPNTMLVYQVTPDAGLKPSGLTSTFTVNRPEESVADAGGEIVSDGGRRREKIAEPFKLRAELSQTVRTVDRIEYHLGPRAVRLIPGSSWGVFTIAATIPIALLVGLWMYKIRPGHTIEASIIGGLLTLVATFLGGMVKDSGFGHWFDMTQLQVTWAMAIYGFVAAVLPVWVLLAPRDYLSSFLKIGTIGLLVFGVLIANPKLQAPAINHTFLSGGPVLGGSASIFPFLFTTIMCGAISGFHALVSSGTTSKMLMRESQARTIGYGAMLIEGLVGVVALIAAASLGPADYYAMNTDLANVPQWQDKITQVGGAGGIEHTNVERLGDYEALAQEPLRGRTGGAVTLAVGIAHIFDQAAASLSTSAESAFKKLWPYWYHFAVMFEALFILTTIDAGTRIGRFLLQEIAGKIHPKLGRPGWIPGSIVSTGLIVFGWAWFMNSDNFATVWRMFGIANQMLAVIALAVVSCFLVNSGRSRYLWVTLLPMGFVATTTGSAATIMVVNLIETMRTQWAQVVPDDKILFNAYVQLIAIALMLACAAVVLAAAARRIWGGMRSGSDAGVAATISP
ncbi:MAG TPA: carbon starvation protein A [Tepidisphaeraceae bacterium]